LRDDWHGETPEERAGLERFKRWYLPVAGGFGAALLVFILWCVWKLAEAILAAA
jgi:hypothetical protein